MFDASPSIVGQISAMLPAVGTNDLGFARIEGGRQNRSEYDKADVAITRATKITRRIGGAQHEIPFDSLMVGMKVEATFTGPVMESYPVRATAESIVVIE
jgi:hypothetical protein